MPTSASRRSPGAPRSDAEVGRPRAANSGARRSGRGGHPAVPEVLAGRPLVAGRPLPAVAEPQSPPGPGARGLLAGALARRADRRHAGIAAAAQTDDADRAPGVALPADDPAE